MESASPPTDGTFNDVVVDLNESIVKIDFKGRRSPVETLFGNMPVNNRMRKVYAFYERLWRREPFWG